MSKLSKTIDKKLDEDKINNKESLRMNLENFLKSKHYSYSKPIDNSVYFDMDFVKQSKIIEISENDVIQDKQTPASIRLIQNSFFILKSEGVRSLFQAAKAKFGK